MNIRGTNGSGKSWLVEQWMATRGAEAYPRRPNLFGNTSQYRKADYYKLSDGGVVLGDYSKTCGGCDTILTQAEVQRRITALLPTARYILFEGLLVSGLYSTWRAYSQSVGGMLWIFLDTPLDICIKRVAARQGNLKVIKGGGQNVVRKHHAVQSVMQKAVAAGEEVIVLNWETAEDEFFKLMRQRCNL